ncbi:MAG: hypothetical protein P8Y00_05450, partial [Deltaproteobacteria bacterium]
ASSSAAWSFGKRPKNAASVPSPSPSVDFFSAPRVFMVKQEERGNHLMKKTWLLGVALLTGIFLIPSAPAIALGGSARYPGTHDNRMKPGGKNRVLAVREYKHLQREKNRFHRGQRMAWSNGYLNRRGRVSMLRTHRRLNRQIFRVRQHRLLANSRGRIGVAAPVAISRPARVRSWSAEPQFHISGFLGDPSWTLGWSFSLP